MMIMKFLLSSMLLVACQAMQLQCPPGLPKEYEITAYRKFRDQQDPSKLVQVRDPAFVVWPFHGKYTFSRRTAVPDANGEVMQGAQYVSKDGDTTIFVDNEGGICRLSSTTWKIRPDGSSYVIGVDKSHIKKVDKLRAARDDHTAKLTFWKGCQAIYSDGLVEIVDDFVDKKGYRIKMKLASSKRQRIEKLDARLKYVFPFLHIKPIVTTKPQPKPKGRQKAAGSPGGASADKVLDHRQRKKEDRKRVAAAQETAKQRELRKVAENIRRQDIEKWKAYYHQMQLNKAPKQKRLGLQERMDIFVKEKCKNNPIKVLDRILYGHKNNLRNMY